MGIIGVVAALTLPNLNSSTGNKEKVAKAQKLYQNLNDAFGRAEAVYGPFDTWFVNDGNDNTAKSKRAGERITEFMKLSKDCGMATGQKCFSDSTDNEATYYKVITADGSSVSINFCGFQAIDLDGPTKGGVAGKDIFGTSFDYDSATRTIRPYCDGHADSLSSTFPDSGAKCGLSWMVLVGNMDYLKAGTDGKCKNNTSITLDGVSNTTCK